MVEKANLYHAHLGEFLNYIYLFVTELLFRWSTRSCITKKKYICEIPIEIVAGVNESIKRKHLKDGRNRRLGHRKKYKPPIANQLN